MLTKRAFAVAAASALFIGGAANADITIDLGGGWEATIFDEANVDLEVDFVGEDTLVLQKFAKFIEVDPFSGKPVPQSIAFNQVADDADTVSRIIITEEFIFNNTDLTWNGFRISLLGSNAAFNPEESADFSFDPFTTFEFQDDNTEAVFGGGLIEPDGTWNPGMESGGLVIDVDLSQDDPVKFILKELPQIPAPGAIALLGIAGVIGRRRRR